MLILASKSPRRRELIKKITNDFIVLPSNIDESKIKADPLILPKELSMAKALDIFKNHKDDKILACDTIVILDNEVMGKPHNKEEAFKMLSKLSGKQHLVISGWTLMDKNKTVSRTVQTKVFFNILNEQLINDYIASGSPMDKAGAYGIQDKEFKLVDHIEGSLDNVIGLPTEDIIKYWF